MATLAAIISLAAGAIGYAVWKWLRSPKRKRFPEVKGWPVLGVLPYIDGGKAMITCAEQWAKEIGTKDGVFEANIAGTQFIFFCSWEAAKPIYDARPYKVGRSSLFKRFAEEVCGVFTAEGPTWRRQRQLVVPAFHSRVIQNYVPAVKTIVGKFVQHLTALGSDPKTSNVNVSQLCLRLTSSILISTLTGEMVEAFTDASLAHVPVASHVDKFFTAVMTRMLAPFEYWNLPIVGSWFPHCNAFKRMTRLITELIEKESTKGKSGTTLLDKLAEAHEGDKLSKDELIGNVLTLFAAGTDTTASTLVWTFLELSLQPELQNELAREAQEAFPNGWDSLEQLEELTLTKAVWWESLRMHAPAPWLALTNNVDVEVAGRVLPAGMSCAMLNRYMINNSKEMQELGADVDVWRPKRWLDGVGGLTKVAMMDLAFGQGARTCPGKSLAHLEGLATIGKAVTSVREVMNFTASTEPDLVVAIERR